MLDQFLFSDLFTVVLFVLYRVFIINPTMAALSVRKPASAGITCDICHAHGNGRRDTGV
jgi:hypothetical protein